MTIKTIGALALASLLMVPATAQQRQTTTTTPRAEETTNSADSSRIDKHIAASLAICNLKEYELSKFVSQKVDNDDVEDFANKMMKEHKKIVSKLEKFAPDAATAKLSDDDDDKDPGNKSSRQYATTTSYGTDKVDRKLITLQRRAAKESLSMIKEEMEDKDDDELAKAYVGSQISAHIGLLAQLTAAERSASGELRDIVKEAKSKTEDHLDEAKDLMKDLK